MNPDPLYVPEDTPAPRPDGGHVLVLAIVVGLVAVAGIVLWVAGRS